jgi:hypothetical protein
MTALVDITEQRFGRWTVINRTENRITKSGRKLIYYNCKCDCGNEKEVAVTSLRSGNSVSCGCWKKELSVKNYHKPLNIGSIFGELTIIKELGKIGPDYKYLCKCSCGKETAVFQGNLVKNHTTSCGHLVTKRNHLSNHRLYPVYKAMIDRATNPNNLASKNYTERGVIIHPDWSNDTIKGFENFCEWATTKGGWEEGLEMDKEAISHNNLIYGPDTCKFVTRSYNMASRRKKVGEHSSNYIGVCLIKTADKWKATVYYENNLHNIGHFNDELEAAKARDKYIKDNDLPHRLNFPNE